MTIFPFNQLAIYVFLVLLLWCWFNTNMAAKGLVEQLCRCLLFFISRLSHWDWKVIPALSTFSAFYVLGKESLNMHGQSHHYSPNDYSPLTLNHWTLTARINADMKRSLKKQTHDKYVLLHPLKNSMTIHTLHKHTLYTILLLRF